MNYTPGEVQAAVEELVRTAVRTEARPGGEREAVADYTAIQEAAASVLLLHPSAPFYVASLAAKRVLELVRSQAERVAEALELVRATARFVAPVRDLTSLENARAALTDLASASSRPASPAGQGGRDLSRAPAFRRFVRSIDSFLDAYGPNLREQGAIVATPDEARAALPALLGALRTGHEEVTGHVTLLRDAMDDFASLGLGEITAARVLARARDKLEERARELAELDEAARLGVLREVTLDLLAQRAVLPKFAAVTRPSPYHPASGVVTAFSDGSHLGSPARLVADVAGPHAIIEGQNELELVLDGAAPEHLSLPLSFVAELVGRVAEPFVIGPTNAELRLEVDESELVVPLAQGTRTAAEIAADVLAALGGTSAVIERVFFPLKLDTLASATSLGGFLARFTLLGGSLTGLGVSAGDELDVVSGENAGTTWTVTAVDPGGAFVEASGLGPVTAALAERVEVGPAARALRLRDTSPADSLGLRRRIRFVPDGGAADRAALTLGFFPGLAARSRPTPARELRDALGASTSRLGAELVFEEVFAGQARTDLGNPVLVVFDGAPALGHDFGWALEITTGPNRGSYLVSAPAAGPPPAAGVEIDRVPPVVRVGDGPAVFSARLLRERLGLVSVDRSIQSEIRIQGGSAAPVFFASAPKGARGTTRYVEVTEIPEALDVGDRLELFETEYNVVSRAFAITAVDRTLRVLELDQEIETTLSLPLGDGTSAAPFARFRVGKVADYDAFKTRLSVWLGRPENQPAFFQELARLFNPLLQSGNPTALAVRDAERALQKLLARLTREGAEAFGALEAPAIADEESLESALDSYQVEPVAAVDALLGSLRESGADCAVDVLLEGRFRDFFGLNLHTASYAGALSESIRQLAREDLPVRKLGRTVGFEERLIASTAERDFEFDTSDADERVVGDGV